MMTYVLQDEWESATTGVFAGLTIPASTGTRLPDDCGRAKYSQCPMRRSGGVSRTLTLEDHPALESATLSVTR